MDINKGRNKNSKKYYKKTTKFINCVQKHSIPNNHHSRTEKLVHQSIEIANLQTEKSPEYHINPVSCKYYIVKRRFAVKHRKFRKNGECVSSSQEQARRCKHTNIKRFVIVPSSYAMGMDKFNDILKKKCSSEKMKKCYEPYSNSVSIVNKKLFHKQSKENICIMNNELNCGNTLLFQCSAASLPLEQSKIIENRKINLNENFSKMETPENMKKKENYNNINDIVPKLMQQVTVYSMLENLKKESNSEDTIYSSISTGSSSSSTREYYLPAVSSSTDTIHVANVLANRRLVEFPLPQGEIISKQQNNNQGIIIENTHNKSNSNLSPVYQKVPLNNEILPFNNKRMNKVGLELNKSNHQIIKMLKENNNGLLSFFPFANFNSLLTNKKSRVIKNYDKSSIGVQTQENKIYDKDEDDSIQFKTKKNKRIKLSKENFIEHDNTKNNHSLGLSMVKTKKNHLNSLPLLINQSCENLRENYNKANKEEIKTLSEHLNKTHANQKEKLSLDCNISNNYIVNNTLSRPKNKSISEDVLITLKNKCNKTHQIKTGINKPKSSLCISNIKLKSSELPVYFKSYTNATNDSYNVSNPYFVKLNPFFDAGFKDPKISRLILSSRTLAGESDNTIHKGKMPSNFTESRKAENFSTTNIGNEYPKSQTILKAAKSSLNEENKFEVEDGCTSDRSIFSADSIIYGSNAFQKIREKFDLMKNKIKTHKENKMFQDEESLNTLGVFTSKSSRENSFESSKNGKNNSQGNDNITGLSSSLIMKENPRKVSTSSFKNEGLPDKKKYLLLLPKSSDLRNHQSEHYFQECHTEEPTGVINNNSKSIDIGLMDDEHKLIDINLKNSSSKELKPSASKNEFKKEVIDIKYLSEKQTQVNMYLVETSEKQVGDTIFNEISIAGNQDVSAIVSDKVAQTAILDYNCSAEAKISSNSSQMGTAISNNHCEAEATMTNNNGPTEGTLLNNYGQPVILYNSSGYPITDLNGRVLKNNLGAYLLNSEKYEDMIKKQLPVFDCDLISISNSSFDPTKVPFVKVQLKITDRCGNPVSLFNNLGWPLTNKDGFLLHDNVGKLLVEMDSFNFPLCCSNGSPIYLQNGAMLLSQKFKFIVTKSDSNPSIKPLKIRRRYKNDGVSDCNLKDTKISGVKTIECKKTFRPLNESNSKEFKNSIVYKPKKRKQNLKHNYFLPTEVPELMHEFFDNKARPRFSSSRSQGCIPQSPIPIFDREGNRLTDENGFPLKDKYGEYMLLLDKNGIALSDSIGGPIFDSNGKQLWLKDLYHMKRHSSLNYLYDKYMPPEHPYIDTSTSSNNQNTRDSSDDLIPLLDLNFENEQSSEPIMNYIKEHNINGYNTDCKRIHFVQNNLCRTHRTPLTPSFLKNFSVPKNEKIYVPPPTTSNVLFYETRSYQEEAEYRNIYESFSQQIDDQIPMPYTYEPSIYEDNIYREEDPQVDNLEQYDNNYSYHDQVFPENSGFHQDAEIQYYVDDNNYVVYY